MDASLLYNRPGDKLREVSLRESAIFARHWPARGFRP
jgi:hypothetical protein